MQIIHQHTFIRSDVVLKKVVLILLLLSFYGLILFPLTQSNWDFVLFPILLVLTLPFISCKAHYSKLTIIYTLLVFGSCLYSYLYNHQALHLVVVHSYKYFALLFFFNLLHSNLTGEEAERILIVISVICCICYILQWIIYPTVLFYGAATESTTLEHYRVRIPGSISCYCMLYYGINKYIINKKIIYVLYSVLGFLPIIIMGFRSLTAISTIFVFLMLPFVTRKFGKTLKYGVIAVIIGFCALQTDLVQTKITEMMKREETGQNFDNDNYIRYRELDYYWNDYFTKPGEKFFGGGAPVDMSTNYRKDIYYNDFAFSDLGLVGLGLIIGFPAVIILIILYLLCIWRFKEQRFQYLRFTLLAVLVGSLFTNSELYRTGNILLFSLFLYIEFKKVKIKTAIK